MRYEGILTNWDDTKGFGFITPASGGKRVFVHINEFRNRNKRPMLNEVITFKLSKDKIGRPCAVDAICQNMESASKSQSQAGKRVGLPTLLAALFLTVEAALSLAGYVSDLIFFYYSGMSLITLLIYGYDKASAVSGKWRTSEDTLHLMSLVGGWPGALIAQDKLRHKSKKRDFRIMFWITVIINCGVLIWLIVSSRVQI